MSQQFEGDYSLKSIKLYPVVKSGYGNAIDIKELVGEITLKESVLSASLYCSIVLQDIDQNLIGSLPLMGQERIELQVTVVQSGNLTSMSIALMVDRCKKRTNICSTLL